MFRKLGPIEGDCDAPHYAIVEACAELGFQAPLDVRWCRLRRFVRSRRDPGNDPCLHPWRWLFGLTKSAPPTCSCGQAIPPMGQYAFTLASEQEVYYLLGQCRRCHTVFWEPTTAPKAEHETKSGHWFRGD